VGKRENGITTAFLIADKPMGIVQIAITLQMPALYRLPIDR
jgi:hypothetical protein